MEHGKQWEFLEGKFMAGQLSHAYLFSGQEGIGKKQFAKGLIKLLNCQNKNRPCAECVNCKLIEKEQYPDLMVVKSNNSESSVKNEKDMMEIDISQIRQVNNFLSYKSYYGNYKAVIIENADRMNIEAQNSFLKTLEEPKGKTVIILLSLKPETLLPTIFSRCQTIKFFPFEKYKESTEDKKTLQELLPILNGQLAEKFQYTKKVNLEGDNFNVILGVLQRYFRNLLLSKLEITDSKSVVNNYSVDKIASIITLIEVLHLKIATTNASPKLALEVLLLEL